MSLLLQALQKAAKNREGNGGEEESGGEHGTSLPETQTSLTLEEIVEPQLASEPESSPPPDSKSAATPQYAASVLSANEAPSYGVLDWIGDHHMLSFLAATAVFAIFYGSYVYIQVSHPSAFRSTPPALTSPIQSATVAPPVATTSVQASVSGMPAETGESSTMPVVAEMAKSDDASASKDQSNELAMRSELHKTDTPHSTTTNSANATAAIQPVRKSLPVRTQPRPAPAQRRVAAVTDSDGVEVIEIPAAPSVSFAGKTEKAAQRKLAVRPQTALNGINPTLLAAYDALQQGEYEKARSLYNEVLARDANDRDALLGLAAIEWKQGRTNVASQYYGRVLEHEPRNSHAQAGLIAILGSADPITAESKLKQLIARDPSGFLYFTLGNLYGEQGQWPHAQQAYFRAFQFQPDNPDYAFNLAVGLEHLGQTKPALDYYRKALDLSFRKGRANFDQGRAIARVGQLSAQVE